MANPKTGSGVLEQERLEFDREKWRAEDSARRDEIDLKRDELSLKRVELNRSRWVNPLVIAILAAAVAALGNAALTLVSSNQQAQLEREKAILNRDLEQTKSEAARILEVVKTNDPDKAAENLRFLMDVGLITDKDTLGRMQAYLRNRKSGSGVSLPAAETTRLLPGLAQLVSKIASPFDLNILLGKHVTEIEPGTAWNSLPIAEEYRNNNIRYMTFFKGNELQDIMNRWRSKEDNYCVSNFSFLLLFFNNEFVYKVELRFMPSQFSNQIQSGPICNDETPVFDAISKRLGGTISTRGSLKELVASRGAYTIKLLTDSGYTDLTFELTASSIKVGAP